MVLVMQARQLQSHTGTHTYAVQEVQSLLTPLGVLAAGGKYHVVRLDPPLQLVVVAMYHRTARESPQCAQHHPAHLATVLLEEELHQLQEAAPRDSLRARRERAETSGIRVAEVFVESMDFVDGERGGEAVLLG